MKKLLKFGGLLLLALLLAGGIAADSILFAPKKIKVRYETLTSEKIPEQLNNVSILFLSDIHYNNFMDEARFQKTVDLVNEMKPDMILFGGDLLDKPDQYPLNEETRQKLIVQLASMKAPLGKFAVLGEMDETSAEIKELIKSILMASNFEVLENRSIKLRNQKAQTINLVGLDNEINGSLDLESAFQNISPNEYTIVLAHTPDTIRKIPQETADMMLAGHSHGGQIYLPVLGPLVKKKQAESYFRGKYTLGSIKLDVTNGVGTTDQDVRLFANAEVVLYRLVHKSAEEK